MKSHVQNGEAAGAGTSRQRFFSWFGRNRRELWISGVLGSMLGTALLIILLRLLHKAAEYGILWFAQELMAFIQAMLQALDIALH